MEICNRASREEKADSKRSYQLLLLLLHILTIIYHIFNIYVIYFACFHAVKDLKRWPLYIAFADLLPVLQPRSTLAFAKTVSF